MDRSKKSNSNKLWTPTRVVFSAVVLSLFAAFGLSSCNSGEKPSNPAPSVRTAPGPAAPPSAVVTLPPNVTNAALKAVTGDPIKLADYNGKVFIVNLWATWCGPCRLEIPELVKLGKEFREQGLEIVGLSTEDPERTGDSVREFIQDYNVDYRIGWATPEVAVTLMQGRDAIPQSFVIGRDGRVVRRFIGFNPVSTPPQIKQAVQEALNGKAAAD